MQLEIVYVKPLNAGYDGFATRFVAGYAALPPGTDHLTTIVFNNGQPTEDDKAIFSAVMPNVKFVVDDQKGYDIGAYQLSCEQSQADMIVFFGASAYFKRSGWLLRMHRAFQEGGPNNQYGCMGNQGDMRPGVGVSPHIRTTGFWMSPKLMRECPFKVTQPEQRHPFEHGPNCLSNWVAGRGGQNVIVTWNGLYNLKNCDSITNGFHRGDQSDILTGDRISEPPYFHCQ